MLDNPACPSQESSKLFEVGKENPLLMIADGTFNKGDRVSGHTRDFVNDLYMEVRKEFVELEGFQVPRIFGNQKVGCVRNGLYLLDRQGFWSITKNIFAEKHGSFPLRD